MPYRKVKRRQKAEGFAKGGPHWKDWRAKCSLIGLQLQACDRPCSWRSDGGRSVREKWQAISASLLRVRERILRSLECAVSHPHSREWLLFTPIFIPSLCFPLGSMVLCPYLYIITCCFSVCIAIKMNCNYLSVCLPLKLWVTFKSVLDPSIYLILTCK